MNGESLARLEALLAGRLPKPIDLDGLDGEAWVLARRVNELSEFMAEIHGFILPLSRGELSRVPRLRRDNYLASPFKELHSRLVHLTWQAEQVANGDYSQRVDFMGDFSEAFNAMVEALDRKEQALQEKISELQGALSHISKLEGMLPICANCKKVRVEAGPSTPEGGEDWVVIERYIEQRMDARFTHSICPECIKKLYPDLADDIDKKKG